MNSIRVARAALRARPTALRAPLQRRTYADVAPDKIQLSLALPHQVRYYILYTRQGALQAMHCDLHAIWRLYSNDRELI